MGDNCQQSYLQYKISLLFIDIILMNQFTLSCKAFRPPIYPKYEKASTIKMEPPRNKVLNHPNKIQREENTTIQGRQGSPTAKNILSSTSIAQASPMQLSKQMKQQIRKQQYQQYSRKNYFKSKRNLAENTNIQSNLTQKILPRNPSHSKQDQKRLKSKSALQYAKYFIKQVSTIPTEPSSNAPNQQKVQCSDQYARKVQNSTEKKSTSIFSHQDREKSRKKISERLKSIKNIRSKSNKGCSIQKQKQILNQESHSPKKIQGNIASIEQSESNLLKMKARARNKRVILKVKQFHSRAPQDDICLMMSSKIDRSFSQRKEVVEKIQLHLQLLNLLPAYVKQFKQIYEQTECWEQLIFLVYKKFYIERLKVQHSLQTKSEDTNQSNPFRFNFCFLNDKDLDYFKNSLQALRLEEKLATENAAIKQSLRLLYNRIIEKSGKHINLYELDNFSQQIYYLMNEQVKLLRQNEEDSLQPIREKRITFIIKCCLMVAFLNGQSIEIESILTQNQWSYKMKTCFSKFIQYYTS